MSNSHRLYQKVNLQQNDSKPDNVDEENIELTEVNLTDEMNLDKSKNQAIADKLSELVLKLQQLPFFNDKQLEILKTYLVKDLTSDDARIKFVETLKVDAWKYKDVENLKLFRTLMESLNSEEGVMKCHNEAGIRHIKTGVPLFEKYTKKHLFEVALDPKTTPNPNPQILKDELHFLRFSESFFHPLFSFFCGTTSSRGAFKALKEEGNIQKAQDRLVVLENKVKNTERKFGM